MRILIAGSREMSKSRCIELLKKYLSEGDIVWMVYEEEFIKGFEGQPQFRTLKKEILLEIQSKISSQNPKLASGFKTIRLSQQLLPQFLEKEHFDKIILINGSWKTAFFRTKVGEILLNKGLKPSFKSPFCSSEEAKTYHSNLKEEIQSNFSIEIKPFLIKPNFNIEDFFMLAEISSRRSWDYTWQTGAVLSVENKPVLYGYNRVFPYETSMMHHGSKKEHGVDKETSHKFLNNLTLNETLHAEIDILIQALNQKIDLENAILYVSLMPCPDCARAIAASRISQVYCKGIHYGGESKEILEEAGKKVNVQN